MIMVNNEAKYLEQCRISLNNAINQPEILRLMSAVGYGPDVIEDGKARWRDARQAYDGNQKEGDESSVASHAFRSQRKELAGFFKRDRNLAKVVFRYDGETAARIGIAESVPKAYVRWIETVKKFYANSLADTAIQSQLLRLEITADRLSEGAERVAALEEARSIYMMEEGESQDATKLKDAAIERLEDWMQDFYAVAKVALSGRPQLAESLGKMVRS